MRRFRIFVLPWMMAAALAAGAAAQDAATPAPVLWSGFQTQGSATAGYRFTDVKGYEPSYLQFFDLNRGLRLEDLNVFGAAAPGANTFADHFSLTASGLGGDPFPTAQLTVGKTGLYDFRATWRQSYYYWNQNDMVLLPPGMPGLTPNQNWSTVRKFGDASFTLHATNDLSFVFDYYRTTNSGDVFTTESPDFLDSPSFWGTFARGSPMELFEPIQDETNRFTGGLNYTIGAWTLHYSLGYQTFNEAINAANAAAGEVSIDTSQKGNSTEPLDNFAQSETRRLSSPISEFSYTGQLTPKLEYTGDYMFYRFAGPASLVQAYNGIGPVTATSALGPYQVSETGTAQVSEPEHVLDQGLTYTFEPWWKATAQYRLERFSSQTSGDFTSLFNDGTLNTSAAQIDWKNGFQDLRLAMQFAPSANLLISPAVHLSRQDIEQIESGVADPATTLGTKTVMPEIGAFYRPAKSVTLRGDLHTSTAGASYTAISPHKQTGGEVQARWDMGDNFSLENDFDADNASLLLTNFVSRVRSNSTSLTYTFAPAFQLFGGFTYESDFAAGDIMYARGTAPLNDTLLDQTVNRVIQGGIEAGPFRHVGLKLTGNFDRTTGVGQISGEAPSDGPLTWPLITGTVYVDVPRAGRLSLDMQRTYYIEQIISGNNFSAEMLTVKWTRAF